MRGTLPVVLKVLRRLHPHRVLFATAVTFQFTVNRTIATAPAGRFSPAVRRITGLATLMLWFGVGCAGRAIAFF